MRRKSSLPKIFPLLILLIFVGVVLWYFASKLFPSASKIILHANPQLQTTADGRTNVLLLGTGGANHDGPNLTDTIMLASLDAKKNKVTLISIPRDLWVTEVAHGHGGKINEAYADGEENEQHKGLLFIKNIVREITGQDVQYAARVDFGGFVKAVDLVGGLDVQVDNTLDDYHYPIDGNEDNTCGHSPDEIKTFTATASAEMDFWDFFSCRYKHLHVDTGVHHMDGVTALEFVRSRHGVNGEGSDFARSRRQQHVIEAFREKLLSAGTLFNVPKLIGLYNIVKDSIDTDIPQEDFSPFIALAQKIKGAKITNAVLDFGDPENNRYGLLDQPPISAAYNYASVLIPRTGVGDYTEITKYVTCEIQKGNCVVSKSPVTSTTQVSSRQ